MSEIQHCNGLSLEQIKIDSYYSMSMLCMAELQLQSLAFPMSPWILKSSQWPGNNLEFESIGVSIAWHPRHDGHWKHIKHIFPMRKRDTVLEPRLFNTQKTAQKPKVLGLKFLMQIKLNIFDHQRPIPSFYLFLHASSLNNQ